MNRNFSVISFVALAAVLAASIFPGAPLLAQISDSSNILSISPASASIKVGETFKFTATQNGQDVTRNAVWSTEYFTSSERDNVEQVSAGTFRGKRHSGTTIVATYNGMRATAHLSVLGTDLQPRVYITPQNVVLAVGSEVSFTAQSDPVACANLGGCPNVENVTQSANWSVSDQSILQRIAPGRYRALKNGNVQVSASHQNLNGSVSVIVGKAPSDTSPSQSSGGALTLIANPVNITDVSWRNHNGMSGAQWLSGGWFVVQTQACHRYDETYGAFVISPNGSITRRVDTCIDSLAPGSDQNDLSLWDHRWAAGNQPIEPTGTNTFVMGGVGALKYPPKQYSVNSQGMASVVSKAWSINPGPNFSSWDPPVYSKELGPQAGGRAYVNGKLLVHESRAYSSQYSFNQLVSYDMPSFTNKKVIQASTLQVPVGGAGRYVIANDLGNFSRSGVYSFDGNNLTKVQQLDFKVTEVIRDSSSATRVGLVASGALHIFDIGANGLSFVRKHSFGQAGRFYGAVTFSGDIFATNSCSTKVPSGYGGIYEDCKIELYRDGKLFSTTPMPAHVEGSVVWPGGMVARGMAISNNNVLLLAGRSSIHLYKIGDGTTTTPPPTQPGFPTGPTGPVTPTQHPGQTFNISYTPTSSVPFVLIRQATVLSASESPRSLSISIFGRTYRVDASSAEIVGYNWRPVGIASFQPGLSVNVWGTLDLADSSLIKAIRVRNPLPTPSGSTQPDSQTTTSPESVTVTVQPTPTATTQVQLNSIQQALQNLLLRLGQ